MATVFVMAACSPDGSVSQEGPPPSSADSDTIDEASGATCEEGTSCAVDRACHLGSCVPGCAIAGRFVPPGPLADEACLTCSPLVAVDELGFAPRGTPCADGVCDAGRCVAGCLIAGVLEPTGAASPGDPCETCDPARATDDWSPQGEGARCGPAGLRCIAGQCSSGCLTEDGAVRVGATKPSDRCLVCDPARDDAGWSVAHDGMVCGDSEVCVSGVCRRGCWSAGQYHPIEDPSPLGPCVRCIEGQPLELAPAPIGTPCDHGVCVAGTCSDGCVVDGAWHPPWIEVSDAPCRWCAPPTSRHALVPRRDGTACGNGGVCTGGECREGCVVGGVHYGPGEGRAGDGCAICDPEVALEALTPVPAGHPCGEAQVCAFGLCLSACVIDGLVVQPGAHAPDRPCLVCHPERTTDTWTQREDGVSCGGASRCEAGVCIPP